MTRTVTTTGAQVSTTSHQRASITGGHTPTPRADIYRQSGPPAAIVYERPRFTPPTPPVYYEPPVVYVPPRPVSCGQYRFWNGDYCADARYEKPYLGPRW